MRQSSTTMAALMLGWVSVTALVALLLMGTQGGIWYTTRSPELASVVWPLLGLVFVSGVLLLLTVHVYVRLLLDDALADS